MKILLFPFSALIASLFAYQYASVFIDFKSWIVPLLMLIMLSMGFTLTTADFVKILKLKRVVLIGVGLQFLVMPLAAFLLAAMFTLPQELLIGMILVGVAAGGTASNVITFLAKGNVALSVSMTTLSTLVAVFMMPLLTWLYLGSSVEVPLFSMLLTLLQIIVVPVALGMLIRRIFKSYIHLMTAFSTVFSMAAIVFIIAVVVALNHANFADLAIVLILAVVLHNLIGLLVGYWVIRCLGYDSVIARTIAIEVGMQNSGLSVALALKFFTPLAALPGAIFSLWHNVSGVFFALYFSNFRK